MNKFNNLRVSSDVDFLRITMPIRGFGDMPIGNGYSGPAYGDKNMPFILGAGAATIGSVAAIGAASGFAMTAAAVVATVSVVATVAGVALTVVGAITGDKDLMKIGAIVGIAGGVTGLATGAFGGATAAASEVAAAGDVAAPAASASATATTAAKGGLLSAGNMSSMSNAITPAFSSVGAQALGATPALTEAAGGLGSTLSTIGQVGSVGSTAAQAIASPSKSMDVSPSTYVQPDSLKTTQAKSADASPSTYVQPDSLKTTQAKSADASPSTYIPQESFSAPVVSAPQMPMTIGASAPNAPDVAKDITKSSSSYFDELMSPKNLAQMTGPALVGIGSGVIQGMGSDQKSVTQNRQVDLNQQDLEFQRMKDARAYANANTQGYNGMATRPLTQEEYDQAKLNKAIIANQTAGLLTKSA